MCQVHALSGEFVNEKKNSYYYGIYIPENLEFSLYRYNNIYRLKEIQVFFRSLKSV